MGPGAIPPPPPPQPFGSAGEFLSALAWSAGDVVTFVDTAERVRFVTREAAAWLGRTPEEVLGRTLRELHEPASYEFFEPRLRRALAGERVQYERSVRHADGRSVWMSA